MVGNLCEYVSPDPANTQIHACSWKVSTYMPHTVFHLKPKLLAQFANILNFGNHC